MNCDIIIATCGQEDWNDLGWSRAHPSAQRALAGHLGRAIRLHEESASISQARNAAALQSEAEWLCFLNAEDELEPGFLDEMEAKQDMSHGSRLLAPSTLPCDPFGKPTGRAHLTHRYWTDPSAECCVGTVVQRNVFLAVGGFEDIVAYSDWHLWLACVAAGCAIVDVPRAVYCKFEHHASGLSFEERRQAWLAARGAA